VIQEKTLDFIKENRGKPFFAYVPIVIPHAELIVPEDEILTKYLGLFPEEPYEGNPGADYGPEMNIGMYCSQKNPHATFAAMVHRLDVYVGQIVSLLDELGIAENTLVMFTSDNGPHMEGGADPVFFNSSAGLRGVKRDLYEGGVRVPFIVSWPGTVKEGLTSDHISAFWDVLPTVGELTGFKPEKTDGISFLPELLGREQARHEFLYWEFHEKGGKQALLKGEWKALRLNVRENPHGPLELYNLETDPSEQKNVADQHPDLVQTFSRMMDGQREASEVFNFGRVTGTL